MAQRSAMLSAAPRGMPSRSARDAGQGFHGAILELTGNSF
jgi:hypothetical protein